MESGDMDFPDDDFDELMAREVDIIAEAAVNKDRGTKAHTVTETNNDIDELLDFAYNDFDDDLELDEEVEQKYDPSDNQETDTSGVPPPCKQHLHILRQFFGHNVFRPMQWRIIQAALQGKDNCVIMATGYGKSLCYQFPAVFGQGVSVVVSPLISLMEDQVLDLEAANIDACLLGSAQQNKSEVYSNMYNNMYRVVYVTPEFVVSCMDVLKKLHRQVNITLFAIDEAHCVSQWGHDFRAAYRSLGQLRMTFPDVPIMTLTATATPKVREDIITSLKLRDPVVTVTSFDRPNLFIDIRSKGDTIENDILPILEHYKEVEEHQFLHGPTIIYCPTKKTTDEIGIILRGHGVNCAVYHAGLTINRRKEAHEKFVRDKVSVIVATIAFGMGINKPDVRRIIHYGAPRDLESYYQEIGRAGRDGLPATCIVFYSNKDFCVNKYLISTIPSEKQQERRLCMLKKMEAFLSLTKCRRYNLLIHFSPISPFKPSLKCCDNCRKKLTGKGKSSGSSRVNDALDDEGRYDFTDDAVNILNTIKGCGDLSIGVLALVLRGSNAQRVKEYWKKLPVFGCGKSKAESYWKVLAKMLVFAEYLTEITISAGGQGAWNRGRGRGFGGKASFVYTVIRLCKLGYQTLCNAKPEIRLELSTEMQEELRYVIKYQRPTMTSNLSTTFDTKPSTSFKPYKFKPSVRKLSHNNTTEQHTIGNISELSDPLEDSAPEEPLKDPRIAKLEVSLYKLLLLTRNQLGDENGFMPYMVASNRTLLLLTEARPKTLQALCKVEGMTEAKVRKFGTKLVEHISKFCKENQLDSDDTVDTSNGEMESKLGSDIKVESFLPKQFGTNKETKFSLESLDNAVPKFTTSSSTVAGNWLVKNRSKSPVDTTDNKPEPDEEARDSNERLNTLQSNVKSRTLNTTQSDNKNIATSQRDNKNLAPSKYSPKVSHYFDQSQNIDSPTISNTATKKQIIGNPSISNTTKKTNNLLNKFVEIENVQKSKKRKGIIYDDSDTDIEEMEDNNESESNSQIESECNSQIESQNSYDKYQKILEDNKRKIESNGWIDTKLMKKKMKKNSLFKK